MISAAALGNVLAWSLQAAVVVGVASVLPWLFRLDAAGVRFVWDHCGVFCGAAGEYGEAGGERVGQNPSFSCKNACDNCVRMTS